VSNIYSFANILPKEDKMSAINLCVVGLANNFTDNLCNKLSIYLDMYYANVQKILDYELQVEDMEKICGKDYLMKKQKSVIKRICEYEDSIINIEYSLLNDQDICAIIKNCALIIYVNIDKNTYLKELESNDVNTNLKVINSDLYEDRSIILRNVADITIDYNSNEEEFLEEFATKLMNYFKR
jgi:shikimate kinase